MPKITFTKNVNIWCHLSTFESKRKLKAGFRRLKTKLKQFLNNFTQLRKNSENDLSDHQNCQNAGVCQKKSIFGSIYDIRPHYCCFGTCKNGQNSTKKEVKSGGRISKIVIFKLLLSQIITVSTKIRKKNRIIQNLIK